MRRFKDKYKLLFLALGLLALGALADELQEDLQLGQWSQTQESGEKDENSLELHQEFNILQTSNFSFNILPKGIKWILPEEKSLSSISFPLPAMVEWKLSAERHEFCRLLFTRLNPIKAP